jgi:competence CoiA-like predicted nuclease
MNSNEPRLTILHLTNFDTGLEEASISLLAKNEESIFKLRRKVEARIQEQNPLYGCSECGQPVAIRSHRVPNGNHTFYFKHLRDSGDCPIKTGSSYTKDEIRCMKYNGAKESYAHMELKHYLVSYLKSDERFSDIKVEKVIKGSGWSKEWKKPDISAQFNQKPVVFEIQLSTTFLDVIVSREIFYQKEGISIFWIFSSLNPEKSRATEKDVFFNNKANALSIDEQSKANSTSSKKLIFTGHYKKPYFIEHEKILSEKWEVMPVSFDEIQFDEETHKPYFISFEKLFKQAKNDQSYYAIKEHIEFLELIVLQDDPDYQTRKKCAEQLSSTGLYNETDLYSGFLNFLKALLSVRDGEVHFKKQSGKWNWLVNYVWDHHIQYWIVFLFTVNVYERTELVFDSKNQKLNQKRNDFKANWKSSSKFKQNPEFYELFSALLPPLKDKLLNLQLNQSP